MNNKVLAIDASNIRAGGGITHLSQFLSHLQLNDSEFSKIIVWSNNHTLSQLPERSWLIKKTNRLLNGNLLMRMYWQTIELGRSLNKTRCDLLFVPGGSFTTNFSPVVTMHQNLLPFEKEEILRYGLSFMTIKWMILRYTQNMSFKKSNGIVFLSKYSQQLLPPGTLNSSVKTTIIPHGIEKRFFKKPGLFEPIASYSQSSPFKIIYISTIDFYKHQWNVAAAVKKLKEKGFPVELEFYGSANPRALKKLLKVIKKINEENGKDFITYKGETSFKEIENLYFSSNLSVFCSSCETFGQIVLETMASGTPLVCSNMSSLPEVVGDGAIMVNPLDVDDICDGIYQIINSTEIRLNLSSKAFDIARNFSWEKTASKTLGFFEDVTKEN